MLERHEVFPSARKADRDWWFATKLGAVIVTTLAAAYVVNATLF